MKRFQPIAPNSAQKITSGVTVLMSIIPEPMVFATAVPKIINAAKLKNAAQITAYFGGSTRVETMVEIELAASCMPLVKSNASAVMIMKIMKIRSGAIYY